MPVGPGRSNSEKFEERLSTCWSGFLSLTWPPCVDGASRCGTTVQVKAGTTTREAGCPECGTVSRRRHSHYERRLTDTAVGRQEVLTHLRVHRFRCGNDACARQTFAEQVPGLTVRYGRRIPGPGRRCGRSRWRWEAGGRPLGRTAVGGGEPNDADPADPQPARSRHGNAPCGGRGGICTAPWTRLRLDPPRHHHVIQIPQDSEITRPHRYAASPARFAHVVPTRKG